LKYKTQQNNSKKYMLVGGRLVIISFRALLETLNSLCTACSA